MTEMEVAAGTEPIASGRTGFRRLMVSLGITGGTQSAMYAGIGSVLLPSQLEQIDRAHKVAALAWSQGSARSSRPCSTRSAERCRTGPDRDSAGARRG